MMKSKIYLILLSISNVALSSMIHKSLEYIDKPESKAAVRKSLGTSSETAQERASLGTGGMSNVDLPRIANEYWSFFKTGEGKFIDLINDKTRQNGYKPLGLMADDIKEIEAFICRFFLTSPSEKGPVQYEYFELATLILPNFLENQYEHKTYEMIRSIIQDDHYSYLGPKEMRFSIAHYLFQNFNKTKKNNPGERYLFVLKNSSSNGSDKFKNEIKTVLNMLEGQVLYIGNLQNPIVDSKVEFLVIKTSDIYSQKYNLDTIFRSDQITFEDILAIYNDQWDGVLRSNTFNPNLKTIVLFEKKNHLNLDRFLFRSKEVIFLCSDEYKDIVMCHEFGPMEWRFKYYFYR